MIRTTIPFAVDLAHESAWTPHPPHAFFVVRFHYYLHDRALNEGVRSGDRQAAYFSPDNVELETLRSVEIEHTHFRCDERLAQFFIEEEAVLEFVTTLASSVKLGIGTIDQSLKASAQQKLKTSLTSTERIQVSDTHKTTVKFEVKQKLLSTSARHENLVAAATYERRAIDVFLHHYDYLLVEYRKTMFGLRKKRRKFPRPADAKHQENRVKLNWPLFSVRYWHFLPESARLIPETQYRNEVEDPFRIDVTALDHGRELPLGRPCKPTLYQLANAAFPLRWIKRKSNWTEAELVAIEEGEHDAAGFRWAPAAT